MHVGVTGVVSVFDESKGTRLQLDVGLLRCSCDTSCCWATAWDLLQRVTVHKIQVSLGDRLVEIEDEARWKMNSLTTLNNSCQASWSRNVKFAIFERYWRMFNNVKPSRLDVSKASSNYYQWKVKINSISKFKVWKFVVFPKQFRHHSKLEHVLHKRNYTSNNYHQIKLVIEMVR